MNEFHEWGKWSRHNPDRLDYPRPWLEMIMRDNVPSLCGGYNITDDEALAVDRAVGKLRAEYGVLYFVLFLYYVWGWSYRQISRRYLTPLKYPHQVDMDDTDSRKRFVHPQIVKRMLEQAEKIVYQNMPKKP